MISQPKIFLRKRKVVEYAFPEMFALCETQNWKFLDKDGVGCKPTTQLLANLGNTTCKRFQKME